MSNWIENVRWRDLLFFLGCALYVCSMVTPDHYTPWTAAINDGLGFSSVMVFVVFVVCFRKKMWVDVGVLAVLSVSLIPLMQRAFGLLSYNSDVFLVSDYLWCLAGGVFVGGNLYVAQKEEKINFINIFLISIYSSGIILALLGVAQWLGVADRVFGYFSASVYFDERMCSNLLQPNMLATALLFSFGASLCLVKRNLMEMPLFFSGSFLLILCVAATFSKAGLISLALIFLYMHFLYFKDKSLYFSSYGTLCFVTFFSSSVYVLAFFGLPYVADGLFIRPLTSTMTLDSVGLRGVLYRQMLFAISQNPWIGYGWNNVRLAQQIGALKFPGVEYTLYSHNFFLDIFVWNGVFLGGILSAVICFWVFGVAFASKRVRKTGFSVVIIPFIFHSLVEYPYAYSAYLLVFGVLMGVMGAEFGMRGWLVRKYYAFVAVVFYFVVNLIVFRDYSVYRSGYVSNSLRVNGVREFKNVVPGRLWILDGEQDALEAMLVKVSSHMKPKDVELLDKASSRFYSGYLIHNSILADYLSGNVNRACRKMAVYESINPPARVRGMEATFLSDLSSDALAKCSKKIIGKYRSV